MNSFQVLSFFNNWRLKKVTHESKFNRHPKILAQSFVSLQIIFRKETQSIHNARSNQSIQRGGKFFTN
jgi:hypothetical protein